jgi:hypothetical protein
MHVFRSIFAVIFAILIANPACCCAGVKLAAEKPAKHSCCSGSTKEKKEAACDCGVKSPQMAEKHIILPDAPAMALPLPPVAVPVPLEIPAQAIEPTVRPHNTGPPGLVMLQRFLI